MGLAKLRKLRRQSNEREVQARAVKKSVGKSKLGRLKKLPPKESIPDTHSVLSTSGDELVEYLRTMTTAPGGTFIHAGGGYPWEEHEDASVHAVMLTVDDDHSIEQANRVLKPGGHLLLESCDTGHIGACRAEDVGFEVRDCISVPDSTVDGNRINYVAKASRSEREAGMDAPEGERGNTHPTVKPIEIMSRLLQGVPKGDVILDPFLGSGTTAIACIHRWRSFIGIEREDEYVQIARARVEHHKAPMFSPSIEIIHADCVEAMAGFEDGSIGAVISDPPYGLEFMGKDWDRLDWTDGGGMMNVGMGGREIPWPSYSGTGAAGTANATCAACGGRMRGGNKCSCDKPDWRVKGQPLNLSANAERMHKQQDSHRIWLTEAFRVLRPGGVIKAFSGTRTFHRMVAAMAEAGFTDLRIESWNYGSGFPKSRNIGADLADWQGWGTALKPSWEPVVVGRKPCE